MGVVLQPEAGQVQGSSEEDRAYLRNLTEYSDCPELRKHRSESGVIKMSGVCKRVS